MRGNRHCAKYCAEIFVIIIAHIPMSSKPVKTRSYAGGAVLISLLVFSAVYFFFIARPALVRKELFSVQTEKNSPPDPLPLTETSSDLATSTWAASGEEWPEDPASAMPDQRDREPLLSLDQPVIHQVPFTSQAPFGDWSDPRQQDGCEEAASLMAVSWARQETFTAKEALAIILAAAAYEEEQYGGFHDTSAQDTNMRILKQYFHYNLARVEKISSPLDIIKPLLAGQIVIAPLDGRKFGNKYYTPPGPDRHMLVVKGYDGAQGEFIINDNGTKRGENYRYEQNLFYEAVRDYQTGNHESASVAAEKNIIIISRE